MKTINGWTKETMIAHVMFNFNGKSEKPHPKDGTVCLYRGPNETKCAVGMFIPDSLYEKKMDYAKNITLLTIFQEYGLKDIMPLSLFDMSELQLIHDSSDPDETLDDMISWIEANVE